MPSTLSRYFKREGATDLLCDYIDRTYTALKEGHITTEIEPQHLAVLEQDIVSSDLDNAFVVDGDRFYFQRYYSYETEIIEWVKGRVKSNQNAFLRNQENLLNLQEWVPKLFPPSIGVDWQKVGALNCFLNDFSIISGGPGTGKTRTVARFLLLHFMVSPRSKVALVAQTGKAAARLKESLNNARTELEDLGVPEDVVNLFDEIVPLTIHRLLGVSNDAPGVVFNHHRDHPLPQDLILLDEASMVDLPLMAKLMDAVKPEAKIVLMGDRNQLCSVEAGSVFGDICSSLQSNRFPEKVEKLLSHYEPHLVAEEKGFGVVVEFMRSYRFSSERGIGLLSQQVLADQLKVESVENDEVTWIKSIDDSKIEEWLNDYEDYIREDDPLKALKRLNQIRVLAAVREGRTGLYELNARVERYLQSKELITVEEGFYENQPIMITRNDYNLQLFNGDVGLIRRNGENLYLFVEDPTKETGVRRIPAGFLRDYTTVFAMTIHKSQGSEFDRVIIVLPDDSNSKVLTRELVYTAVTRAKKGVMLVGSEEVLQKAVNRKVERVSGIKERLEL